MSVLALEINDAALRVADATGTLVSSPGYALLDGRNIAYGAVAASRALLQPTRVNHRFWEILRREPIAQPAGHQLTYCDLAYGHLQGIWRELTVRDVATVLVVPSDYSTAQLGHLAGIAQAVGIAVSAVVDAALASSATLPQTGDTLHLDAQLHRLVLTRISGGVGRDAVAVLPGLGIASLSNAVVQAAARSFLQASRFDPLHQASTEQALHDQVPAITRQLETQEVARIALEAGGHRYQAQLHRRELAEGLAGARQQVLDLLTPQLRSAPAAQVSVAQRLASMLPGLVEAIAEVGVRPQVLDEEAAIAGALANYHRLLRDPGTLRLTTRLDEARTP